MRRRLLLLMLLLLLLLLMKLLLLLLRCLASTAGLATAAAVIATGVLLLIASSASSTGASSSAASSLSTASATATSSVSATTSTVHVHAALVLWIIAEGSAVHRVRHRAIGSSIVWHAVGRAHHAGRHLAWLHGITHLALLMLHSRYLSWVHKLWWMMTRMHDLTTGIIILRNEHGHWLRLLRRWRRWGRLRLLLGRTGLRRSFGCSVSFLRLRQGWRLC